MNEITKKPTSALAMVKDYLSKEEVESRFNKMLGERASAFMNSVINLVSNSKKLQDCHPGTIVNAALRAASFNLPIDPALGYAAIVAYKNIAEFQMMYKGVIQLCIRSGQYARIYNTEIYKDELKSWNPITGETTFNDPEKYEMRYNKDPNDVAGYYAYFKLLSGFECQLYMPAREVLAHAKKYAPAYQYDLKNGTKASMWSTDIISMGKKTVIKQLLDKFGIKSIDMQQATIDESVDFDDLYLDDELLSEQEEDKGGVESVKKKLKTKAKKKKRGRGRPRKYPKKEEIEDIEPEPEQADETESEETIESEPEQSEFTEETDEPEKTAGAEISENSPIRYQCKNNHLFGNDTVIRTPKGELQCPICLSISVDDLWSKYGSGD